MLGDDISGSLPEMQAHAESRMRDTCTITFEGAPGAWNGDTGTYGPSAPVVAYEGKCRIGTRNLKGQPVVSGEAEWAVTDVIVSIPASSPNPPIRAMVTITAVAPESDQALLDAKFWVAGYASRGSQVTARRLHCKEV